MNFDDAADRMKVPRLVLKRGCEALLQRGFIETRNDTLCHATQDCSARPIRTRITEFVMDRPLLFCKQRIIRIT